MSVTKDEAIKQIEKLKSYCEYMADSDESGAYLFDLDGQALDLALSALRPITREQVEKMRGEWMFPIFADQQDANDPRCQCSECGSTETPLARHRFCPACGAPMTDEAIDLLAKRLEEVLNEKENT